MNIKILFRVFLIGLLVISIFSQISALPSIETQKRILPLPTSSAAPAYCIAAHDVGKIALSVTNYGVFGAGATSSAAYIKGSRTDCFTGNNVPACTYPKGSPNQYLYSGNFWIGAVVGTDTLVSVGADGWAPDQEFNPDESPFGDLKRRSIIDPSSSEYDGAVSEQDIIAIYTDSFTTGVLGLSNDVIDGRPHRPLKVEVSQRSFAWSYSYAEDFILFDYKIKNVNQRRLNNVYIGLYVDADVCGLDNLATGPNDDLCGFVRDIPSLPMVSGGCTGFRDTINLAWVADNDGDFDRAVTVPAVTGMRIVRTPADTPKVSFNWWIGHQDPNLDYGPQTREKYRDLGTGGEGTPEGDRNKYYFLKNEEFDFDQIYTASIRIDDEDWKFPNPSRSVLFSKGYDTRYLLSFGPFNLDPGQEVPVSFAYVVGDNFHRIQNNALDNLINNYRPDTWYNNVDFSDFGLNSMWASWVYDNPGVDTDGDEYKGKFRVCPDTVIKIDTISLDPFVTDTNDVIDSVQIWYEGDGVPDFSGASPPPAPYSWLNPTDGKITVRFNGWRTETTPDVFSTKIDFEGYRVYLGLDERSSSYSVIESYDKENFNKYVYGVTFSGEDGFVLKEEPFTLEQLRTLYSNGDPNWYPLTFTVSSPYRKPGYELDSIFYFSKQDYNNSIFGVNTKIRKIYPEEPPLPQSILTVFQTLTQSSIDSLMQDTSANKYLTEDGYPKYYEYELVIENLLPTIPYFITVTAFDYGSPSSGLSSLETSPTIGYKVAYPQGPSPKGTDWVNQVYTYPNPYRIDGNYNAEGYEGRDKDTRDKGTERQRIINFANLPAKCWIRIFTLDGDLICEKRHDTNPADPLFSHDKWNVITRNTQAPVSGLYYWTVEDDEGNVQIGKLVIIK